MKRLPATAVVFLLALGLYAATTHRRVFIAGNDASRWAAIESLVDYGTASIESSRFAANIDRIRIGEREYSNKPPLLSLAGAAIYAVLQATFGWSLAGAGAAKVLYWVTLLLVGVPSAWLVARFFAELRRFPELDGRWRGLLAGALGAGTLLFTFSTTLNNHTVAAALLFAAFVAAIDGRGFTSGLAVGLAAAVDLLPGLGFAPVFGWLLLARWHARRAGSFRGRVGLLSRAGRRRQSGNARFAAAGQAGRRCGRPFDAGGSRGRGRRAAAEPALSARDPVRQPRALHGLAGAASSVPGACFSPAAVRRPDRRPGRREMSVPGASSPRGIALQIAGHAALAGSYGGWSYGYRYLLPIQPLLLFCAPLDPARVPGSGCSLRWSCRFRCSSPLSGPTIPGRRRFEQESSGHPVAKLVTNPVGGNAAGWLAEHAPESALAGWTAGRFVSADRAEQRRYFALFFGSKGDTATMRRFAD